MIKRIVLENWKSHKHSEFEFDKGTNILVGAIGAGKSSIMDAICFALFGTYPMLNSKKIALEETIMRKPNECEYAKVLLEFQFKEKNYSIERIITKGKANQAKLFQTGQFMVGPKPTDVTEKVEEILELNYELFSRAVYSEQNQIDFFLKLNPSQRKEKFDDLLELKKYERVRTNSVSVANRLKKIIEDRKKLLKEEELKLNENELSSLEEKILEKNDLLNKLIEEINANEKKVIVLEQQVKELEEKSIEFFFLKELKIKTQTKISESIKFIQAIESETNKKLEELEELKLSELKKELEEQIQIQSEKKEELIKSKNQLELINNKILFHLQEKKTKLKEVPKEIDSIEKLLKFIQVLEASELELKEFLKELKSLIEAKQQSLNELIQEESISKALLTETEKHLHSLENAHSKCPTCKKDLDFESQKQLIKESIELVQHLNRKIQNAFNSKTKNEKELNELKKTIGLKENELLELKEKINKTKSLSKVFDLIELVNVEVKKLSELKESQEILILGLKNEFREEELKAKQKELNGFEKLFNALQKNTEVQELEKELNSIERRIVELNFDEKNLNEFKKIFIEEKERKNSLEKQVNSIKELIQEIGKNIYSIKDRKKQLIELKEKNNSMELMTNKLNLFTNSLKATQAELRELLIDSINQAMQDIWPRIYPYKDFVNIKIEIQEGDYEILVEEKNGKWIRVEGILSGGERSAVALTIRIAVSLVLAQNLSWLILDEPTHNLDSAAVTELSNLMREHLPELVEQIFVITHDKEMEKAATGSLYFLDRNKNEEGITKPLLEQMEG